MSPSDSAARNTPKRGEDPQADFSSLSTADRNFLSVFRGSCLWCLSPKRGSTVVKTHLTRYTTVMCHPSSDLPVTHSDIPEYHVSDLDVRPLVFRERWEVSFNEYVWSEPCLLHLQVCVLLTEEGRSNTLSVYQCNDHTRPQTSGNYLEDPSLSIWLSPDIEDWDSIM